MKNYSFIVADAHCDTLTAVLETKSSFLKSTLHLDLERMMKYKSFLQFFAAFISPQYYLNPFKRANDIIKKAYQLEEEYKEKFKICRTYDDIKSGFSEKKVCAILSIEGGEALEGVEESVDFFYGRGVRCMSLTWNNDNDLADGVAGRALNNGLSELGKKIIRRMESIGMILDVSHLSEKAFWDVVDMATKPFIATHSNSKKICFHIRNLSDEQIKAIVKSGGIIGVNVYPDFLKKTKRAELSHIVEHISYIASIAGEEGLCLGADFDGIDKVTKEVRGVEDIGKIAEELYKKNFSASFIKGVMGLNLLKFLEKNLKMK